MRVLHTSDWHLGRSLEGRSRQAEHEAFIDEFCDLADQEKVDLILLAGDVFDSVNPPGSAEQLFCDALDRLADGGRRAVVVIAGNHDNPERLTAVQPLAGRYGICLLGLPGDDLSHLAGQPRSKARGDKRSALLKAGPSWLEIGLPGCGQAAVISALPYPSEARLNQLLTRALDEEALQAAYSDRIGRILAELSRNFRPDTVNIAISHLYLAGGLEASERPIQMGTAYAVSPAAIPAAAPLAAQYLALGHLHRPQGVDSAPILTRYSGSPLAFDFGEAGQAKSVVLLDIAPGQAPKYDLIPVSAGKPLVRWEAKGGLEQALRWCREGRDQNAWIDLTICGADSLPASAIQEIRAAHDGIIQIRPQPAQTEGLETAAPTIRTMSLPEQFQAFYRKRNNGNDPSPEVVRLFLELATDEDEPDLRSEASGDPDDGDPKEVAS